MSRYFEDRVTDDPYIGLSNHVVGDSSSGPYGTYFDKFFLNSSLFWCFIFFIFSCFAAVHPPKRKATTMDMSDELARKKTLREAKAKARARTEAQARTQPEVKAGLLSPLLPRKLMCRWQHLTILYSRHLLSHQSSLKQGDNILALGRNTWLPGVKRYCNCYRGWQKPSAWGKGVPTAKTWWKLGVWGRGVPTAMTWRKPGTWGREVLAGLSGLELFELSSSWVSSGNLCLAK